jgi:hypothetical protein
MIAGQPLSGLLAESPMPPREIMTLSGARVRRWGGMG